MKLTWLLVLALLTLHHSTHAYVLISDTSGADADWDVFSAGATGGATNAVAQDATPGQGNPSPYRQMIHFLPCTATPCPGPSGTPSTLGVNHRYTAATYTPSSEGAIHHLNVRMDRRLFSVSPNDPSAGVGSGFRAYQGGNAYYAGSETFTNRAWATQSLANLTAGSFSSGGPDFSATGGAIHFGFFRSNSNTGQGTDVTLIHDLDNFTVEIYWATDNDLTLTKQASATSIFYGGSLTYTLNLANVGAVTATSVTITDTLPANVTFVSAEASQGTCAQVGDLVICNLGALPAGSNATATIVVTPNVVGVITNAATVASAEPDVQPDNNSATAITTVLAEGNDLTVSLDAIFSACATTTKGEACPVDAQLLLRNNGAVYGDAVVTLTNTCTTTKLPAKCKLRGILTVNDLDLTGLPDHSLAFYLSDDTTLDAGDFYMKSLKLSKALGSFVKGKSVKLSLKLPSGVDLTGKRILVAVDSANDVPESNESNNTAASPAIPALP